MRNFKKHTAGLRVCAAAVLAGTWKRSLDFEKLILSTLAFLQDSYWGTKEWTLDAMDVGLCKPRHARDGEIPVIHATGDLKPRDRPNRTGIPGIGRSANRRGLAWAGTLGRCFAKKL